MITRPVVRSRAELATAAAVVVVLAVALFLRLLDLDHVPGLNGDEAWYGVQLQRMQAGLPIELTAPSGRLSTNVFLLALLAPLQLVAGPGILVLRLPALIAGVLTVWLGWAVVRPVWGRITALATALLLACLPLDIAFSRFGWDPSLMGPFMLLAIGAAARGRWAAAHLAIGAGILVHPTAVLLLPAVWGLLLGGAGWEREPWTLRRVLRWTVFALTAAGLVLLTHALGGEHRVPAGMNAADRITNPVQAWRFVSGFFDALSGRSAITYLVTWAPSPTVWRVAETVGLTLAGAVWVAGLAVAARRRAHLDLGLLLGTTASVALLYLASGFDAMDADYVRYACFAVPAVVLSLVVAAKHAARVVPALARRLGSAPVAGPGPRSAVAVTLAVSVALLAVTEFGYLRPLRRDGSRTHAAFWVGRPDPREQALQVIRSRSGADPANVYCQDWWACYPLEYLAGGPDGRIRSSLLTPQLVPTLPARSPVFVVVETGSFVDRKVAEQYRADRSSRQRWLLRDVAGRPTYTVYLL